MYLDTPLILYIQRRNPTLTRLSPLVGVLGMAVSLVGASFARNTAQLIATQGALYALAGSVCYCPCILYLDGWFARRKGFAYGVMWAGTGLGGLLLPLLIESMLRRLGFEWTMRVWGASLAVGLLPLISFVKPRVEPRNVRHETGREAEEGAAQVNEAEFPLTSRRDAASTTYEEPPETARTIFSVARAVLLQLGIGFIFERDFLVYQTASMVTSIGFFLPTIYLPAYARNTLHASAQESVLAVMLLNVATVVGIIALGTLSDHLHVTTCIGISAAGTIISVFLIWGLAVNVRWLYAFCVSYGLFAGSYVAAWPRIMDAVVSERSSLKSERKAMLRAAMAVEPPVDDYDSEATLCELTEEFSGSTMQQGESVEDIEDIRPPDQSSGKPCQHDRMMVFGLLAAGRGIGNITSGPLSAALIRGEPWKGKMYGAYGSGYGPLVVVTGLTAIIGGAPLICKIVDFFT